MGSSLVRTSSESVVRRLGLLRPSTKGPARPTVRQSSQRPRRLNANRTIAHEDPKALLKRYPTKTIFDEIQRCPHLLSYLQTIVDASQTNGQFVLTGSHQLELHQAISQSLAGRTGMLHLLPLSIAELAGNGMTFDSFETYLFHGFLPRVYSQKQRPQSAYSSVSV